jgi:hypothetical protein
VRKLLDALTTEEKSEAAAPEDFSTQGKTIIEAIESPDLFGPLFRKQETWGNWKVFLKGVFGLQMSEAERTFYTDHTGRKVSPSRQF